MHLFAFYLLYTILRGNWPEIFIFATDPSLTNTSRLLRAPIHLSDDVMISLRSGYIFNAIGIPAFNHFDLAQPSTSYLAPYLFALLFKLFTGNTPILIYAGFGLASVFFCFYIIAYGARSQINAMCIISLLCLTTSNLGYALNGWDHLFQALFLCLATSLVFNKFKYKSIDLYSIGAYLAVAVLFRPDGLILAIAILIALYFSLKKKQGIFKAFFPFFAIIFTGILINLLQFGMLIPTSIRLKLGASPSLKYSWEYFLNYGVFEYSAITLLSLFFTLYFIFKKISSRKEDIVIFIGCLITFSVNFYNSDVFGGGRMYWSSACIMGVILAHNFPALISGQYTASTILSHSIKFFLMVVGLVVICFLVLNLPTLLKQKFSASVITDTKFYNSPIAQQYQIAKWINSNLTPGNGSIGFFYLGTSYYLPDFQIADFLGKADEVIASTPVKYGPPGHNKWDIDKTLNKWDLQSIVPTLNSDRNIPEALSRANDAVKKQDAWRYTAELLLNDTVHKKFDYCYLKEVSTKIPADKFGFFLRKDIALQHSQSLRCN